MKHPLPPLILLASLAVLSACRDDSRPLPSSPAGVAANVARVADYDIQMIDVAIPEDAQEPQAWGINGHGDIVGRYLAPDSHWRGFLQSGNQFQTILFPGALSTIAASINENGDIVGDWMDEGGRIHGYLLHDGEYTDIDRAGATMVAALGINERGEISGFWSDASGDHGYVLRGGNFTSFDVPDAGGTYAYGISPQGDVVGYYCDATRCPGFVRRADGTIVTGFEPPDQGVRYWYFADMNARGDISGEYDWYDPVSRHWRTDSFVRAADGTYAKIALPGNPSTELAGINAAGVIAGFTLGPSHAFIAVPRHAPAD